MALPLEDLVPAILMGDGCSSSVRTSYQQSVSRYQGMRDNAATLCTPMGLAGRFSFPSVVELNCARSVIPVVSSKTEEARLDGGQRIYRMVLMQMVSDYSEGLWRPDTGPKRTAR
jgi:hypothetical protein